MLCRCSTYINIRRLSKKSAKINLSSRVHGPGTRDQGPGSRGQGPGTSHRAGTKELRLLVASPSVTKSPLAQASHEHHCQILGCLTKTYKEIKKNISFGRVVARVVVHFKKENSFFFLKTNNYPSNYPIQIRDFYKGFV